LSGVTVTAASVQVVGGAGNDTFVSGSSPETFTGGAGADTFAGTSVNLNGDTITDLSPGDKIVVTDGNFAHFSLRQNGTSLSFDPDSSVSNTFRTVNLPNGPIGHFVVAADPVAGVDITLLPLPPAHVLWQNDAGPVAEWLISGTTQTFGTMIGNNPGPSWHVIGDGDFSGDGNAAATAISAATATPMSCFRTPTASRHSG
jgi:hypothetical protein